jgi:hypothetical protein
MGFAFPDLTKFNCNHRTPFHSITLIAIMKLKEIRPVIWSTQIKVTISFYSEVPGFGCKAFHEDWGWAAFQCDNIELMVAYPN